MIWQWQVRGSIDKDGKGQAELARKGEKDVRDR